MTAAEARAEPEALPRPRRRALAIAAGTLWLPCLLPLVLGLLSGSEHALRWYLISLPAVPGMIFPVLLQLDDAAFAVVALVPTLAAFAGLYAAAREVPRPWLYGLQTAVIVAVGVEAIGFAYALRA